MFLVELVLQGVRGVRELVRLRFQRGFNFVAGGNESGKTASVDTAVRLLFPANDPDAIHTLISQHTPENSRGAIVAFSNDEAYYRVIQDFSKRAVNLSRYNAPTKEFKLMYKDLENTAQFMSGLVGGVTEEEYKRLFIFRREDYRSRLGRVSADREAAPTPKTEPAKPVHIKGSPEARLAELRETLRKAEEAADADYRLQSGKLKLEEIKKKLNQIDEIDRRYADIDQHLQELQGCSALPPNIAELLDEHEQREARKLSDSDQLTKEIEAVKLQAATIPQFNLTTDKLFIAGAALFGVSVIAGLFILTSEQSAYFPLGILVSLGLVGAAWYNGTRKTAERKMLLDEAERLEAEAVELEKNFEQSGGVVSGFMKATGSTKAAELKDKAENYRYFLSLRQDIDEQRKRLLGETDMEAIKKEYESAQEEVAELEKAAHELAPYAIDTYSIRQDIERLQMNSPGMMDDGYDDSEPSAHSGFAQPLSSSDEQEGFAGELELASRIGSIDMEILIPAVEAAAQRNLSALTGGKYVRIDAGNGGPPTVHAEDDSVVNFADLSGGTKDAVYFCLRAGLIEALAGKVRLPFILDDPLTAFDPARQQAACQILRALGGKTQVILYTSNPVLKAAGDPAAELK